MTIINDKISSLLSLWSKESDSEEALERNSLLGTAAHPLCDSLWLHCREAAKPWSIPVREISLHNSLCPVAKLGNCSKAIRNFKSGFEIKRMSK